MLLLFLLLLLLLLLLFVVVVVVCCCLLFVVCCLLLSSTGCSIPGAIPSTIALIPTAAMLTNGAVTGATTEERGE